MVFSKIRFENNNTRKCMIELRSNIKGFYKGLIYCSCLNEAKQISSKLDKHLAKHIRKNLNSTIKRGCTEYAFEYPDYEKINNFGPQKMEYNKDWLKIENQILKFVA